VAASPAGGQRIKRHGCRALKSRMTGAGLARRASGSRRDAVRLVGPDLRGSFPTLPPSQVPAVSAPKGARFPRIFGRCRSRAVAGRGWPSRGCSTVIGLVTRRRLKPELGDAMTLPLLDPIQQSRSIALGRGTLRVLCDPEIASTSVSPNAATRWSVCPRVTAAYDARHRDWRPLHHGADGTSGCIALARARVPVCEITRPASSADDRRAEGGCAAHDDADAQQPFSGVRAPT
jgi:hypothetical protein